MEPGLEGHIIYTTHEYDWYKNSIQTLCPGSCDLPVSYPHNLPYCDDSR